MFLAKNVIRNLLKTDPATRISIQELMSSPFIQSKKPLPIVYSGLALSSLIDSTNDENSPDSAIGLSAECDNQNYCENRDENADFEQVQPIIKMDNKDKPSRLFLRPTIFS